MLQTPVEWVFMGFHGDMGSYGNQAFGFRYQASCKSVSLLGQNFCRIIFFEVYPVFCAPFCAAAHKKSPLQKLIMANGLWFLNKQYKNFLRQSGPPTEPEKKKTVYLKGLHGQSCAQCFAASWI